jgi:hypothetical protein
MGNSNILTEEFSSVRLATRSMTYLVRRVHGLKCSAGYGLDDRAVGVRFRAGVRDFFSPILYIGSGAHPFSYSTVTEGPFPRGKRPKREVDYSAAPGV